MGTDDNYPIEYFFLLAYWFFSSFYFFIILAMEYQTSRRRILATPDPKTPMDPTHKMNLKPTPLTTTTKNHHHLQDPTAIHPSTIQNISHRFSKLYASHKKLVSNGGHSKSLPHPQPDSRFQEKTLTFSPVSDTSCTALTKSNSQNERSGNLMMTKVMEKEKFSTRTKKPSSKTDPMKSSIEVYDVKKASQLMSKSLESDQVKRFHQGFEVKRSSMPSIPPIINGGRRKSFCSSQIELADFFSCNGVKVVAVDMPPFMQIQAVDIARKTRDSLEKFTSKTLAFTLKKEFDGVYGPAWHCIVGTSFGSFVTHSVGGFMYFSMDHKIYILLFKTTVQKAE